jgi:hypothetical protein
MRGGNYDEAGNVIETHEQMLAPRLQHHHERP